MAHKVKAQIARQEREAAAARAAAKKAREDKERREAKERGESTMADTTTAHTILRQAPFIEDQQRKLLDFAEGVSNVRIALPGQHVAPFDPLTQAAFTTGRGIGQYQPLLNTAQGTVGTGLGTLQDLSGGVGQQFRAGAGTTSRAIQELQGRGLYGPEQRFGQAGEALSGVSGQYAAGPGYTAQGYDPARQARPGERMDPGSLSESFFPDPANAGWRPGPRPRPTRPGPAGPPLSDRSSPGSWRPGEPWIWEDVAQPAQPKEVYDPSTLPWTVPLTELPSSLGDMRTDPGLERPMPARDPNIDQAQLLDPTGEIRNRLGPRQTLADIFPDYTGPKTIAEQQGGGTLGGADLTPEFQKYIESQGYNVQGHPMAPDAGPLITKDGKDIFGGSPPVQPLPSALPAELITGRGDYNEETGRIEPEPGPGQGYPSIPPGADLLPASPLSAPIADAGSVASSPASGQGYPSIPPGVAAYFNPYEDAAVQQALTDIRRQGDIAQNQLSAQAVGAGAFGGSRQGLQSAELGRNVLEQQGRTAAGMRQTGFQTAMQQSMAAFEAQQRRAQAESQFGTQVGQQSFEQARQRQLALAQGLGALGGQQAGAQAQYAQTLGGLGSGLAGIGAGQAQEAARLGLGIGSLGTTQANIASAAQNMLGQQAQLQSSLGALGQTQAQRQLDATQQNLLRQAYEPYQRYNWMSDILKPTIGSASSTLATTTAPSPSGLSQLIGGGVAALGLNKALGNPIGSLFGN